MNLDRKNKNNNPYLFFTNFQLNFSILLIMNLGFRGGSVTKNLPANAGNAGCIPGSGRSPGEGNGNLLPYSCLGNPMDRGASVQFSLSVVSGSLWPRRLQHNRLPCPTPTPGACSNSHPSSLWGHPTISSSVAPFSSCLQSFPASGSFPMSQLFTWGGQKLEF